MAKTGLGIASTFDSFFEPYIPAAPRYDFEQEPTILEGQKEYPFHPAQRLVWESESPIVFACAGKQSGKSCTGPPWVLRELQRKGGGAFLVIGPTYKVMERQIVPACETLWTRRLGMGELKKGSMKFEFNAKGLAMLGVSEAVVWFCFAENPASLVSVTASGAWLDEPGHPDFTKAAWEEIGARVTIRNGRRLLTASPYAHNWAKFDIYDRAKERKYYEFGNLNVDTRETGDPNITVVSYKTIDNPTCSIEKWEELKATTAAWKFDMNYGGEFTKPAGVVFDCFDHENECDRFDIPTHWRRFAGHDFGPVHTAGLWCAQAPQDCANDPVPSWVRPGDFFFYSQYQSGNKSVEDHSASFHQKANGSLSGAWGGTWSEDGWRNDFSLHDYPILRPPVRDLVEGIQRMYAMIASKKVRFFRDLPVVDDIRAYSYELDDADEPIQDRIAKKSSWHVVDSLRVLLVALYSMAQGPMIVHRRMGSLTESRW